ncbi:sigma-E factor negative regulatory protein [unidentified bacterial endosymbiont]|uniref:sigma-E factor negative regulatory protein n=1 Tax=unidentified bacterial endosymbiont TaxID=2355 RepID=UPI0020A00DEB|nr:sigma-E factor negative regulatory protein [unidentified bacterial endosymbiont]
MQKQERLSVLMDGECADGQVIDDTLCDQLLRDRSLQQQWQRYHLIRDTLQGNLSQDLPVDFAARVAHALQNDRQKLYNRAPLAADRTTGKRWWTAWAASMNQLGDISLAAGVALLLLYGAHCYQGASATASRHQVSLYPLPLGGETLSVGYSRTRQQQRQALRQQLLNSKMKDYARLRQQPLEANQAVKESSQR